MRQLLTEVDVIRVIKEHIEFLVDEYNMVFKDGSLIIDESITMDKVFNSFYEKMDCRLENNLFNFFITFDYGFVIRLRNLPGYYKNKRKTDFYPFYNDVITSWDEEV